MTAASPECLLFCRQKWSLPWFLNTFDQVRLQKSHRKKNRITPRNCQHPVQKKKQDYSSKLSTSSPATCVATKRIIKDTSLSVCPWLYNVKTAPCCLSALRSLHQMLMVNFKSLSRLSSFVFRLLWFPFVPSYTFIPYRLIQKKMLLLSYLDAMSPLTDFACHVLPFISEKKKKRLAVWKSTVLRAFLTRMPRLFYSPLRFPEESIVAV